MGLTEGESVRIAGLRKPVNHRTARIGIAKNLRRLVKSLSGRIINCGTDDLHFRWRTYFNNLGVTAGNKQAEEWEMGLFAPFPEDEMGKYMAMQMVNFHQWKMKAVSK